MGVRPILNRDRQLRQESHRAHSEEPARPLVRASTAPSMPALRARPMCLGTGVEREDLLAAVDELDGRGSLVRVHADDDLSDACLFLDRTGVRAARWAERVGGWQTPREPPSVPVAGGT